MEKMRYVSVSSLAYRSDPRSRFSRSTLRNFVDRAKLEHNLCKYTMWFQRHKRLKIVSGQLKI